MDLNFLDKVKKTAIIALISDDELMDRLVLKGGNAINIIYHLSSRASIDLDFSIQDDFKEDELNIIKVKIKELLKDGFKKEGFILFDYKFQQRPEKLDETVKSFWGGYEIEFKLLAEIEYDKRKDNIDALRRNAIPLGKNLSTRYSIEISKFEFCSSKQRMDLEGYTIYVYTPEMIIIEKLRAICQQVEDYKSIIKTISRKSRARDFFDIYILSDYSKINLTSEDNLDLLKAIFDSKKVPYHYLKKIKDTKELHRAEYPSLIDTVTYKEGLKDFEFYFEYTVELAEKILESLGIK